MDNIYDADIQKAPIYCVGFKINDSRQHESPEIANVNGTLDFGLTIAVYVPQNFRNQYLRENNSVFFTCLSQNKVIGQKIGKLLLEKTYDPLLFRYKIPFLIHNFTGNELNFQAAWTTKYHPGNSEMGIGESLRLGRFLKTTIPVYRGDTNE